MSLNRATLIGNVGQDPKIMTTQTGGKFATFSLATSEKWTDKQTGEVKEQTDWHNIVVSTDGLANVVEQYIKKGSRLFVEGRLRTRKYQDSNGQDRYVTEIVVGGFNSSLQILDRREGTPADPQAEPASEAAPTGWGNTSTDLDDDVPF